VKHHLCNSLFPIEDIPRDHSSLHQSLFSSRHPYIHKKTIRGQREFVEFHASSLPVNQQTLNPGGGSRNLTKQPPNLYERRMEARQRAIHTAARREGGAGPDICCVFIAYSIWCVSRMAYSFSCPVCYGFPCFLCFQ
jgi:hypothetical protein